VARAPAPASRPFPRAPRPPTPGPVERAWLERQTAPGHRREWAAEVIWPPPRHPQHHPADGPGPPTDTGVAVTAPAPGGEGRERGPAFHWVPAPPRPVPDEDGPREWRREPAWDRGWEDPHEPHVAGEFREATHPGPDDDGPCAWGRESRPAWDLRDASHTRHGHTAPTEGPSDTHPPDYREAVRPGPEDAWRREREASPPGTTTAGSPTRPPSSTPALPHLPSPAEYRPPGHGARPRPLLPQCAPPSAVSAGAAPRAAP